jgi:hypothetical protein
VGQAKLPNSGPGEISFERPLDANFLEDKCDFLEFGIQGFIDGITTNIKLTTGVTVEVRMDEIQISHGETLAFELNMMTRSVVGIVQFFEDWFEENKPMAH